MKLHIHCQLSALWCIQYHGAISFFILNCQQSAEETGKTSHSERPASSGKSDYIIYMVVLLYMKLQGLQLIPDHS